MIKKTALALALCMLSLPAVAQTTGNGPYYANPSWDQTLPTTQRFIVLSNFATEAVLDRETGLVWQRFPNGGGDSASSESLCMSAQIGGRFGWRLPSVPELMSLMDPTQGVPALPAGHPFQNVQGVYWSSNPFIIFPDHTWSVDSANASLHTDKLFANAWCVRGPAPDASPR